MKLIVFIITLVMIKCSGEKMNAWYTKQGKGLLSKDQRFDELLILDDKIALLFGTEDTDENRLEKRETKNWILNDFAVIYRTEDGGNSWSKQGFGKGGNWRYSYSNEIIYASKQTKNYKNNKEYSVIYLSKDQGKTWEQTFKMWGNVNFIRLDKNLNGIITGKLHEDELYNSFYKVDKGEKSIISKKIGRNPIYYNGKLIYLSTTNINENKLESQIKFYDLEMDSVYKEVLPEEFKPEVVFMDTWLWIIGKRGENLCLYKRVKENEYELINYFKADRHIFCKKIHVCGDKILLVIGSLHSHITANSIFYSSDGGVSWVEEKLPISSYFKPSDFTCINGEIAGMVFSGAGRIQTRQIR